MSSPPTLSLSLFLSLSLSLSPTLPLSLLLSLSRSLSHTLAHTLPPSLSSLLSHTDSLFLSLCPSHSLCERNTETKSVRLLSLGCFYHLETFYLSLSRSLALALSHPSLSLRLIFNYSLSLCLTSLSIYHSMFISLSRLSVVSLFPSLSKLITILDLIFLLSSAVNPQLQSSSK